MSNCLVAEHFTQSENHPLAPAYPLQARECSPLAVPAQTVDALSDLITDHPIRDTPKAAGPGARVDAYLFDAETISVKVMGGS